MGAGAPPGGFNWEDLDGYHVCPKSVHWENYNLCEVTFLYFPTSVNSLHVSLTPASPQKSCLLTDKFSSSLQSSKWLTSSPVSPEQNRRLYKNSFWDVQGSFLLSFISVNTLNYNMEANKIQANVLKYVFLLLYYVCICWNCATLIIVPNEVYKAELV